MSDSDLFEWSTGLPDDFNFLVMEGYFGYNPESNFPNALKLFLKGVSDDVEVGEDGEYELQLGTGNGWEPVDRGARAVREDGNEKKLFNANSGIAKFYSEALSCDESVEKVLRQKAQDEGLDTRSAAFLVGTAWHMKQKKIKYGGEIGERDVLLPNAFLGVGTNIHDIVSGKTTASGNGAAAKAAGPVKKAPAKKAAGPVKKAAGTAAPPAATEVDENHPLWDSLYNLAMECEDVNTFQTRAFGEVAGVSDDEALTMDLMEDGGKVWAKAVADFEAAQA